MTFVLRRALLASAAMGRKPPSFDFTFTATGADTLTLQRVTPTGGTCLVTWGDGTTTTIAAGNVLATTHTYAGAGAYTVTFHHAERITWFEVNGNTKIKATFALADLPASMTYLHMGSTSSVITGTLADLPTSMTYLALDSTSSVITGTLADLPASMTLLSFGSTSSVITGTLADLPALMQYLNLYSTSSVITGTLADLPASMTYLYLFSTSSVITGGVAAMAAKGIREIYLNNCGLDQATVNSVIDRLYADILLFTYATPLLNIGGTNAAPSATPEIDTYIPALQADGWTITYTLP